MKKHPPSSFIWLSCYRAFARAMRVFLISCTWFWSGCVCLPCQLGGGHDFKHRKQIIHLRGHDWAAAAGKSEAACGGSSCSACLVRNKILGVGRYPWVLCTRPFDTKPVACWIEDSLDVLDSVTVCLAFHFKKKWAWDTLFFYLLPLNSSAFRFRLMKKSCYMLPL